MNNSLRIKNSWLYTCSMVFYFIISFGQESTPCPPIEGEIKIGSIVNNPQPRSTAIEIAIGDCNASVPIWQIVYLNKIVSSSYILTQGDRLFVDRNLITPFRGGANTYITKFVDNLTQAVRNDQITISELGITSYAIPCPEVLPSTCKSYTLFAPISGIVNVSYLDCNGFYKQHSIAEGFSPRTFCATAIQEISDIEYLRNDGLCVPGNLITNIQVDTTRVACISQNADANIGATLSMTGTLTVDTLFTIEANLTQDGFNCSNPQVLRFEIEVLKGNNSGSLDFCIGDFSTRNQTICSIRVVDHNNNIDSIQLSN